MSAAICGMAAPHIAALMRATATSKLLTQKSRQSRSQEARIAARLLDRVAQPIVPCAGYDASAHGEVRLLERKQEFLRLRAMIDHVVFVAPGQVDRGLVVGDDR